MKNRLIIILIIQTLLLAACNDNKTQPQPGKAVQLLPAQNEVCTSGAVVSATQSKVTFKWTAALNTTTYEVVIKDLLTNIVITQLTTETQIDVTLPRSTPYSWKIIARSDATINTTASDTWKFYHSGPGVVSYPPFPATLISPSFAQTVSGTSVNFVWSGSDPDDTVLTYNLYLGTVASPTLFKDSITDKFLNAVSLNANTTYYWKIVTKDARGNSSDSGIFQFKVN